MSASATPISIQLRECRWSWSSGVYGTLQVIQRGPPKGFLHFDTSDDLSLHFLSFIFLQRCCNVPKMSTPWDNFREWAEFRAAFSCAGARKACCSPSLACSRRPAGACMRHKAITLDKCSDWLQQLCLTNIPTWAAKIILFHFRRGSILK